MDIDIREFLGSGKLCKVVVSPCKGLVVFEFEMRTLLMLRESECYERVELVDVCGGWADLEGQPLVSAMKRINVVDTCEIEYDYDCYKGWTFYELASPKGVVSMRWQGASNGYYGVDVHIMQYYPEEGCWPHDVAGDLLEGASGTGSCE